MSSWDQSSEWYERPSAGTSEAEEEEAEELKELEDLEEGLEELRFSPEG